MARIFSLLLFFASILFLPWYFSVVIGIFIISQWKAYTSAIIGGILLDTLYGGPIITLYGFAYIYTGLFVVLVILAFFLRRAMME